LPTHNPKGRKNTLPPPPRIQRGVALHPSKLLWVGERIKRGRVRQLSPYPPLTPKGRQLSKPLTKNPKATFPLPQRGGVRGGKGEATFPFTPKYEATFPFTLPYPKGNLEGVKATPLTPSKLPLDSW